jgi:hypothetical protein
MHQPSGTKGVARPLAPEVVARDPPELAIDRVEQPVHGVGIAAADLQEEIGDLLAILVRELGSCHGTCCAGHCWCEAGGIFHF